MRISNSFSESEIQMMDFILSTLLRGGTPHMAVRSKDFAAVCRKVQAMKVRVQEIKDGKVPAGGGRKVEKSSVGLIGAPDMQDDASDGSEAGDDLEHVG
jgi:hypothetical protein